MKKITRKLRFPLAAVFGLILVLTACSNKPESNEIVKLHVTPAEAVLTVDGENDGSLKFSAEFERESGDLFEAAVDWTVSDDAVAEVSSDGLVTAVGEGTATLTATSKTEASLTGTAAITVKPAEPEDPSNGDTDEDKNGDEDRDGDEGQNGSQNGDSDDNGDDDADDDKNGDTNGDTDEIITVKLDVTNVSLVRTQQQIITASVEGAPEDEDTVTWTSSNTNVVTVNGTGNTATVTAVDGGLATITAASKADPTATATASVTVSASSLAIELELDFDFPAENEDGEITATLQNVFPGADQGISWKVEPSTALDLDTDSSGSGGTIKFTAQELGEVTITATSDQDSTVIASETFTVRSKTVDPEVLLYVGTATTGAAADGWEPGSYYNPHSSIQTAVDAALEPANTGDPAPEIRLLAEKHTISNKISLNKRVKLTGEDKHSIVIDHDPASDTVFDLLVNDIHLEGLSVEMAPAAIASRLYIVNFNRKSATVSNSEFRGSQDGAIHKNVSVFRNPTGTSAPTNPVVIENNRFENLDRIGYVYGSAPSGNEVDFRITENTSINTNGLSISSAVRKFALNDNTFIDTPSGKYGITFLYADYSMEYPRESSQTIEDFLEQLSGQNNGAPVRYMVSGAGHTYVDGEYTSP